MTSKVALGHPGYVVVYSKEGCPYCVRAKALLRDILVEDKLIIVELDKEERPSEYILWANRLKDVYPDHGTFPWIFVGQEFLGGFTDINRAYVMGTLETTMRRNNIDSDSLKEDDFF